MTEDPITVAAHEIRDLIDAINGTWLQGDPADLDRFFHDDVVIQPPGDTPRVHGIGACIASYQEFVRQAHVRQFTPQEAEIDVFGDTAVATYRYRVIYDLGDETYDETGGELLVLLRSGSDWRVAWRTILT
jgi:ketosteroid isomerase-like protein